MFFPATQLTRLLLWLDVVKESYVGVFFQWLRFTIITQTIAFSFVWRKVIKLQIFVCSSSYTACFLLEVNRPGKATPTSAYYFIFWSQCNYEIFYLFACCGLKFMTLYDHHDHPHDPLNFNFNDGRLSKDDISRSEN